MAVSGEKIRALRDAKAWSQAHLAEAANLSLRTVQRVEAEGTASGETRLAIAAALGVPVESLNAAAPADAGAALPQAQTDADDMPTAARVGVFAVASAGLLFALWLGSGLPPQVASHFGAAGDANGWMSRDAFVATMGAVLCLQPVLLQAGLTLALKFGRVNIPNARYWLAAPRRAAAVRSLHAHLAWLCVGLDAFLAWVFWLVAAANRASPTHPALDSHLLVIGTGAMLAGMTAWIASISVRFRRGGRL